MEWMLDHNAQGLIERFRKEVFAPHHRFVYAQPLVDVIDAAFQNAFPFGICRPDIARTMCEESGSRWTNRSALSSDRGQGGTSETSPPLRWPPLSIHQRTDLRAAHCNPRAEHRRPACG